MPDLKSALCPCFWICLWLTTIPQISLQYRNTFRSTFMWFYGVKAGYTVDKSLSFCSSVCLFVYRSDLGCTSSSGEPAQPPAPHVRPPPAAVLQSQRDCSVTHHRSNPVHPGTSPPATPSYDSPLPADATVDPAAALYGPEHAKPASVPLRSAHGCTVRPHCPSQPGGSSKPSQCDGKWPLNISPRPHPAPCPASDQWTGSSSSGGGSASSAHSCRQSGWS